MAEAPKPPPTRDLNELVQALPQELQNEILEHTLAVEREVVNIIRIYRPPSRLAINHATRKKFAKSYYELSTFQLFTTTWFQSGGASPVLNFIQWTQSLPDEHAALIKRIHFRTDRQYFVPRFERSRRVYAESALLGCHLRHLDPGPIREIFKLAIRVNHGCEGVDGQVQETWETFLQLKARIGSIVLGAGGQLLYHPDFKV